MSHVVFISLKATKSGHFWMDSSEESRSWPRDSAREFSFELGEHDGRTYLFHARATPDFNDPVDWAVLIYTRERVSHWSIEIAKIDNSHGEPHLHRYHRFWERREPIAISFYEAMTYLEQRWKSFVREYVSP